MSYLFYLTFGPIQGFIEQSRKTRDLYAASQILSVLAGAAVAKVKEMEGKLIIPQVCAQSLPNYLLAEFSVQPDGASVKTALQEKFREIARESLKKTGLANKPAGFDAQINEHLEIHWAALETCPEPVEWVSAGETYPQAYARLQRLVAALKNTRHFSQINQGNGEAGRKCSLDGQRNALFYRNNSTGQAPAYLNQAVQLNASKLRPNEGLSAPSLVKRYYDNGKTEFPSTAKISLMRWLEAIEQDPESQKILADMKTKIGKDWDEQLLFPENLTRKYFEKNGFEGYTEHLPALQDALTQLDQHPAKKTKYYALLAYDGDKMGEHLSGQHYPDKTTLKDFHQSLSIELAGFAEQSRSILSPPKGQTVYAGGDDFLGFVCLPDVFELALQLRTEFNTKVNGVFQLKSPLTFSAGIVIAHYKTPLHVALHNVRQVLTDTAKEKVKRDAFAIRILKHSGESHECGFKWNLAEQSPLSDMQYILSQLKENFSTNFMQALNQEMRIFHQATPDRDIIAGEVTRLIGRSAQHENLKQEKIDLAAAVMRLSDASRYTDMGVENFLEALNVCKFLLREVG